MRISLASAKHNWIALQQSQTGARLDFSIQWSSWITIGSLRITAPLDWVFALKSSWNVSLLLATSKTEFSWAQEVKFTLKPSWKSNQHEEILETSFGGNSKTGYTFELNWFGKLRHYWITLRDWPATTGLDLGRTGSLLDSRWRIDTLLPNLSYILILYRTSVTPVQTVW